MTATLIGCVWNGDNVNDAVFPKEGQRFLHTDGYIFTYINDTWTITQYGRATTDAPDVLDLYSAGDLAKLTGENLIGIPKINNINIATSNDVERLFKKIDALINYTINSEMSKYSNNIISSNNVAIKTGTVRNIVETQGGGDVTPFGDDIEQMMKSSSPISMSQPSFPDGGSVELSSCAWILIPRLNQEMLHTQRYNAYRRGDIIMRDANIAALPTNGSSISDVTPSTFTPLCLENRIAIGEGDIKYYYSDCVFDYLVIGRR